MQHAFLTTVLTLLAACAADAPGRPSFRAACDALVRPTVGRSLDILIESTRLGPPDARTDCVDAGQSGVSRWRCTFQIHIKRKCGGLDVYTDADGTVTGFNFWNDGVTPTP